MGTIKMKDKTAEAAGNLDAQILKDDEIAQVEQVKKAQWEDPAVRGEDEAKTDEYSRHYYLNNGTAKSVISAVPVNFFDEEEKEWKQIDNTLIEQGDAFVNKASAYKTEISKADINKSVKMTKKDLQLSWTYLGKQSAVTPCALTAETKPDTAIAKEKTVLQVEENENAVMKKTLSRAVYENIENCTDLEYCLQGNNLKENIIVKEKSDDYRYMFALNTQGLSMRLSEDSTQIELCSGDKTEFTIPAPYMYDAEGKTSEEVYYELDSNADGSYTFAVVADADWINAADRAMPVTIDPQIVTGNIELLSAKVECRSKFMNSSSGYSYSNWTNTSITDIKIYKNSNAEFRTHITINKKALNILKNRIASVKLIFSPTKTFSGYFNLDGVRRYYNSNSGKLEINLTAQFKNNNIASVIRFEPTSSFYSDYIDGSFSMTSIPPVLEIEYFTNEYIKPCTRSFTLAENTEGVLDIPTGEFSPVITSVSGEGLTLPYDVAHIFKKSAAIYNVGSNFRLNLHERLKKEDDSPLYSNYVYTDEYGNKHGFKEHFYYLDEDNNKVTITDKTKITVDTDGSLWYADNSGAERAVTKEQLSDTGLKAVTKLEGVKNIDLLEQRQDEIKQLSEQVDSYENALKDFVLIDNTGEIKYRLRDYLDEPEDFKTFTNMISENMLPMSENEAHSYRSMYLQNIAMGYQDRSYNLQDKSLDEQLHSLNLQRKSLAHQEGMNGFQAQSMMLSQISMQLQIESINNSAKRANSNDETKLNDDEKRNNAATISNIEEQKDNLSDQIDCITMQQTDAREQRERLWIQERAAESQQALNSDMQANNTLQKTAVNNQLAMLQNKRTIYTKQIKQYYKEYVNKKAELELREKYNPVNYLTDGQTVKGFNEKGELVAIFDSYENSIMFERDKKNRISRIVDNKEKAIVFTYNYSGYLSSITDVRGRKTKYHYMSGKLHSIEFHDGTTLTVRYNGTQISNFESSNKAASVITYSGTRLTGITYSTKISKIAHGKTEESELWQTLSGIAVTYGTAQTTITDNSDLKVTEQYNFDSNGNLGEYKKEECGKVVQAERYDYKKYEKDNVTYAKKDTLNKTPLSAFAFVADEFKNITLNDFNNPVTEKTGWTVIGYDENTKPETPTKQKTLTTYEYDDNHRAVKEITDATTKYTDKETTIRSVKTYAYNSQGSVVRTESYVEKQDGEKFVLDISLGKSIEETVYDDKGRTVKSFKYNSLDTSSKFYTENEYDENGKVTAEIDETGENKTKIEYIDGTETVRSKILPNGSKFSYGHDENDTVTAITQSTEDGEENSTQTEYTCGEITELRSGNNVVNYEYDYKGRKTAVDLNGTKAYVKYKYDDITNSNNVKTGDKITATMANGDIIESEQDLRGNMLNATYKTYNSETDKHTATALTVATYDDKNQLKTLADKISGVAYGWDYDTLDRIKTYTGGRIAESYEYNSDGDVSKKTVTVDGENRVYEYAYKNIAAKDLESVTVGNICSLPKADCLGRNTGKEIKVNGITLASESIAYRKHGDHATNMPSAMRYGNHVATVGDKTQFVQLDNLKYKYDSCGNISEVWENGTLAAKYTYDKLNRIVREDNRVHEKTWLYSYDNNGNILSKRVLNFTLRNTELLEEVGLNRQYGYDGDRLLSYDGKYCEYDALGNPTNYLGKACSWQRGRQLSAYNGITFEYDGQGRRTKKVGNTTVTFVYDSNGNLVLQDYPQKSIKLKFLYDNGGLCAVQKGEDTFYYRKDAQGNIIALLDGSGVVVVRYVYDAWGSHKVLTPDGSELADQTHIGNLNPFRYRGYYYDVETGLYFLKTRYYDHETGRFITIDDLQYLDPEHINGLNLYAYCGNNPVMNVDPEGTKWWDWLLGGLSLLAGIALCFVPGGQVFGVGLIVGGASSLVSCSLDAAGVSGKWASIITSGLSIIAGIALCFTPFAGIGAGMIGQGVGAIAGGFISEACGGSFTTGAAIGGFIGSIVGGAAYRGVTNYRLSKMTPYQKGVMGEKYVKAIYGDKAYKPTTGSNRPDLLFKDGSTLIEVKNVATQGYTGQLQRYLNMGVEKNIIYVRLGTKISSALKNSAYIIKYFPW